MKKITKRTGVYYWVEGDGRTHYDIDMITALERTIPDYWKDICPKCGNIEKISGCRCVISHRTCPKCGTEWHWIVNRLEARTEVIIESAEISHKRAVGEAS